MLALAAYEAGLCPGCQGVLSETAAPEHDYNNMFGTAVYLPAPGTPVQCHCCAALERSERDTAAMKPLHPAALRHAVRLVPRG